jgi:hypothetical protein
MYVVRKDGEAKVMKYFKTHTLARKYFDRLVKSWMNTNKYFSRGDQPYWIEER